MIYMCNSVAVDKLTILYFFDILYRQDYTDMYQYVLILRTVSIVNQRHPKSFRIKNYAQKNLSYNRGGG